MAQGQMEVTAKVEPTLLCALGRGLVQVGVQGFAAEYREGDILNSFL